MTSYIIHGGVKGRQRLAVLREAMHPSTQGLLTAVGPVSGARVLDLGCGGGDVTRELARRVDASGLVVGVDYDGVELEIAREETRQAGIGNVRYVQSDLFAEGALAAAGAPFDMVYSRFLLSHVTDPDLALSLIRAALKPGGRLIVEDVEFAGHFCYPPSPAFDRYVALYRQAAQLRGADPDIGPSLPRRLSATGFGELGMTMAQPVGWTGPAKEITALTIEAIADAVAEAGLASGEELSGLAAELRRLADDETTIMATPRIFQVWGQAPG